MPTKRAQAQAQSQATATVSSTTTSTRSPSTSTAPPPTTPSKPSKRTQADSSNSPSAILLNLFTAYDSQTPQRVKLIDSFLAFLVGVGVLQFVYCCLAGNYVSDARANAG
ncbi:MAG: hypothetical protein M1825_000663 [Sarcosagium campestre]|nr:MAG: hypothetical protein M1825_000663 [Sarcosagium campestre]